MDRIAGIGDHDHVARRRDRLRHVGEAFLRAQRGDDLGFGVEFHAEATPVIGRLRATQARNPARGRIAVGARLATVSLSFSMTCAGAGKSGLPIPRSMMSAPALRAAAFARLTCSKT